MKVGNYSKNLRSNLAKRRKPRLPLWERLGPFGILLNPQPQLLSGRIVQTVEIGILAILVIATILVQLQADYDMAQTRSAKHAEVLRVERLVQSIHELAMLLANEMELMFESTNSSYESFLQNSQDVMHAIDAKLIRNGGDWPRGDDFKDVYDEWRINVSSPEKLRTALKWQRDLRKGSESVTEQDVLKFYSLLINQLSAVSQTMIFECPRFLGWQDMMAASVVFQAWTNFKMYSFIGRKLAHENKTSDTSDSMFSRFIESHELYNLFYSIASSYSEYSKLQMANLTELDSTKEVVKIYTSLITGNYDSGSTKITIHDHLANIEHAMRNLQHHADELISMYTGTFSNLEIFTAVFIAVAAACSVGGLAAHLIGSWMLLNNIAQSYKILDDLKEALSQIYDCVPFGLVNKAQARTMLPVQRFDDTCVLMMDLYNVQDLQESCDEADSFCQIMGSVFEVIEESSRKYNCFKVNFTSGYFIFAAGVGEIHILDHCMELVSLALEIHENADELKTANGDLLDIRFRTGIHCGPCFSRIVYLNIPRSCVYGEVIQTAGLVHATSLPQKVQVSAAIFQRLSNLSEIEFFPRGQLKYNDNFVDLYWANWADVATAAENEASSIASFSSTARNRSKMD